MRILNIALTDDEAALIELLQETIAAVGENVVIRRFVRYEL